MASPNSILALDIGTQTISLAQFQTTPGGGLALNAYRLVEIPGEPASDSARGPQAGAALRQAIDALEIRRATVHYSISGQSVFARFVKLPPVAPDKVEQIITFEAQQNVPFPINDVVWDYQLIGAPHQAQVEVALVAIKADLLEEINRGVEEAGLKPRIVDIAPMALYNAFRYNYSDLDGCTLLIDIGSRTTNLIFAEPHRLFSRSIPIGGGSITTAVAKELDEAFAPAEERKRREGFVSLGGSYADPPDPVVAKMSKVIRNTMTRIHAEINRSISFYRTQQQGNAPARAFLCGGSAGLPYMREFFQEKLALPVDYFNPLRNVAVTRNVDVQAVVKEAHRLGEVVGLGLRGATACPMELNLRPASVVREQAMAAQRPYLYVAGLCTLACLAGWGAFFVRGGEIKSRMLTQTNAKVADLQKFERAFSAIERRNDALKQEAASVLDTVSDRDAWIAIIDDINSRLPRDFVWITQITPTFQGTPIAFGDMEEVEKTKPAPPKTPPGKAGPSAAAAAQAAPPAEVRIDGLHVRGLYFWNRPNQQQVVNQFVENLAESPHFKLDLADIQSVVATLTTPSNKEWAFEYELKLALRHPLRAK